MCLNYLKLDDQLKKFLMKTTTYRKKHNKNILIVILVIWGLAIEEKLSNAYEDNPCCFQHDFC